MNFRECWPCFCLNCWCDRYVTLVWPSGKLTRRRIQKAAVNVLELWRTHRLKSGRTSTNLELSNMTSTALLCCSGSYSVNNNRSRTVIYVAVYRRFNWHDNRVNSFKKFNVFYIFTKFLMAPEFTSVWLYEWPWTLHSFEFKLPVTGTHVNVSAVNLSQPSGQLQLLYQRWVRDRVRERDRLSIKQLGELLHQHQCSLRVGLL